MSGLFAANVTTSTTENKLGSLRIQTSSQGVPIALAYGLTRLPINLIYYEDFLAHSHTVSEESGGKGGATTTQNSTTYTYTAAMMLGLCEGPIGSYALTPVVPTMVGRVWKAKEIVTLAQTGFEAFLGTYTQTPWAYLTTNHPTKAWNLQGQAYLAGVFDLGDSDSLPNFSFETYGLLTPSDCTPDVNPADVVIDLLLNRKYGAGWPFGSLATMATFRNFAAASNFMVAPAYPTQEMANSMIEKLCKIANVGAVWTGNTLTFVPYGDANCSHTPNLPSMGGNCSAGATVNFTANLSANYDLGPNDFIGLIDPVRVSRKRKSDAFNSIRIECLDRTNGYNVAIVEAKDLASIRRYGLRPQDVVEMHEICDPTIAQRVAQTILQRQNILNNYEFTLGRRHTRLDPMDIVTLTEPSINLLGKSVRLTSVEHLADEVGIKIVAEDLVPGLATAPDYGTASTDPYIKNLNTPPGNVNAPVIFQPPLPMTANSPQVWLGTSGESEDWGGAQIWFSDDGTTYGQIGTITSPARHGFLTANVPADMDPGTANVPVDITVSRGTLTSGTTTQADAGDTLSFMGTPTEPEVFAYSDALLTGPYQYNLDGYKRRGIDGFPRAHLAGDQFMRLDGSVNSFTVDQTRVGMTVHLKFLSFNTVGLGLQALDEVADYLYTIQPFDLYSRVILTPVVGLGQVGSLAFSVPATVTLTGVAGTGAAGEVGPHIPGLGSITGVAAVGSTGNVTAGNGSDPSFALVKFGVNFSGSNGSTSATDFSASVRPITFVGNAQLDTGQSTNGANASLNLDGTGDYLTVPDSADWAPGANVNHCWEFFVRPNGNLGGTRDLLSQATGAGVYPWRIYQAGGVNAPVGVLMFDANSSLIVNFVSSINLPENQWSHVAITREGDTVRIATRGVFDLTGATGAGAALFDATDTLKIGTYDPGGAGNNWNGWIQGIRYTLGSARYPGGANFTAPTLPFPTS